MAEVSVIIPNYNHAVYLNQRIDSVLAQTYRDFELIILDDCSTDHSKEIIEKYRGHEKISDIVYNEANGGTTFKQWQKGISIAAGKYVWIAESDDWCEPTLLETLMNGLLANDKCVLAYVQSYYITNDNDIDKVSAHSKLTEYVNGTEYVSKYLTGINSIFNASMAVFKKELYHNLSLEYTRFKFCGDWLFWIGIARQGEVMISGKALNYFRKHKNDITGKVLLSGYNFIEENRVLKILKDELVINDDDYKKHLLKQYTDYLYNRKRLTKAVRLETENFLFTSGDRSYKFFLKSRVSRFSLFRVRIAKRIARMLN